MEKHDNLVTPQSVHERLYLLSKRRKCDCQIPRNDTKQESDDENCIFSPHINHTHEALLNCWTEGNSVFDRLYGNALFLRDKRERIVQLNDLTLMNQVSSVSSRTFEEKKRIKRKKTTLVSPLFSQVTSYQ